MGSSNQRPPSHITYKPRVQELHDLFQGEVRERLAGLGVRGEDVEELVQVVFSIANRRLAVIPRNNEAARRWLMEVVRKQVSNYRNLYRHAHEVLDPEAIEEAIAFPEDPEAHYATIALVQAAARLMPAQEREILLRHDVDGEPLREIAAWLGLKKSGAHVRVKLARKRFVEKLALVEAQRPGGKRLRRSRLLMPIWIPPCIFAAWRWIAEKFLRRR